MYILKQQYMYNIYIYIHTCQYMYMYMHSKKPAFADMTAVCVDSRCLSAIGRTRGCLCACRRTGTVHTLACNCSTELGKQAREKKQRQNNVQIARCRPSAGSMTPVRAGESMERERGEGKHPVIRNDKLSRPGPAAAVRVLGAEGLLAASSILFRTKLCETCLSDKHL